MSYNYRETQLKEIINRGVYWMANAHLATIYVAELRSMGYDAYVIHGLGNGGVKDVIFLPSYAPTLMKILKDRIRTVEQELATLNEATKEIEKIIHG